MKDDEENLEENGNTKSSKIWKLLILTTLNFSLVYTKKNNFFFNK